MSPPITTAVPQDRTPGASSTRPSPGMRSQPEIQRPLKHEVADQLFPVYQRMADPSLLKRLAKGKTQNANERLHSMMWSKCPKTVFVGKQSGVASAISSVNVRGYTADPSDGETWGQNPVRSAAPFWSPWTLPELRVQSIK